MRVWIAVVEHRHRQNVYAARTKRGLLEQLYEYVQEWWESEIPDEEMPTNLSKKQEALLREFAALETKKLSSKLKNILKGKESEAAG